MAISEAGFFILHSGGWYRGGATPAILHANDFLSSGADEPGQISELIGPRSAKGKREANDA